MPPRPSLAAADSSRPSKGPCPLILAAARLRHSLLVPVLGLMLLAVLTVSARGDFPLNDDWVYGKAVQNLLAQHRYMTHPFAAANVVVHVLWGALFAAPFGFSFTVLRLSTLVLSVIAVWMAAECGREAGLSYGTALLCGLAVLSNPIFLNLSYTYMSDVPFMAFAGVSGIFYLRALKTNRTADSVWASVFAALAFGVRQFGVLLTLAFLLTLVYGRVRWGRKGLARHTAACAVPWVILGAGLAALKVAGGPSYTWLVLLEGAPMLYRILLALRYPFAALLYAGLFTLPLFVGRAVLLARRIERWTRRRWLTFGLIALAIDVVACGVVLLPLPLMPNVLRDFGTGPLTLREVYFDARDWAPVQIGAWWWLVTIPAIASAAVLATDLLYGVLPTVLRTDAPAVHKDWNGLRRDHVLFLTLWAVSMLAAPYNPYLPAVFDRYLLPASVPLAILAAAAIRTVGSTRAVQVAAAACLVLFVVSLACVQDYMAWNRARWTGIDQLLETYRADPLEIDGGYEYNGMYTSDTFMERAGTTDFNQMGPTGWWILDDAYAVSFLPRSGFRELERVPYFSFLGMETRHLLVLERK